MLSELLGNTASNLVISFFSQSPWGPEVVHSDHLVLLPPSVLPCPAFLPAPPSRAAQHSSPSSPWSDACKEGTPAPLTQASQSSFSPLGMGSRTTPSPKPFFPPELHLLPLQVPPCGTKGVKVSPEEAGARRTPRALRAHGAFIPGSPAILLLSRVQHPQKFKRRR